MGAEQRAIGAALEIGELLENIDLCGDTKAPFTYNGVAVEGVEEGVVHFVFVITLPPSDDSPGALSFELGVLWRGNKVEVFENDNVLNEAFAEFPVTSEEELWQTLQRAVNAGITRYGFRLRHRIKEAKDRLWCCV